MFQPYLFCGTSCILLSFPFPLSQFNTNFSAGHMNVLRMFQYTRYFFFLFVFFCLSLCVNLSAALLSRHGWHFYSSVVNRGGSDFNFNCPKINTPAIIMKVTIRSFSCRFWKCERLARGRQVQHVWCRAARLTQWSLQVGKFCQGFEGNTPLLTSVDVAPPTSLSTEGLTTSLQSNLLP